MLACGLDIGSVVAKAVVMDNGQILSYSIQPTGIDIPKIAEKVAKEALDRASLSFRDVDRFIAEKTEEISSAVDDGLLCDSGMVVNASGNVTRFSPNGFNFQGIKHFTCEDGSGELFVNLEARIDFRKGQNLQLERHHLRLVLWNQSSG